MYMFTDVLTYSRALIAPIHHTYDKLEMSFYASKASLAKCP